MTTQPTLPAQALPPEPFVGLIDEEWRSGIELAPQFADVLGVRWVIPERAARPYLMMGFAVARDGRISFATPGHVGGGDVSRFNGNDLWLLALMRARADVVMVGDGTLRAEPEHVWTSDFLLPAAAEAFAGLREHEGRAALPVTAFLSLEGDLPADAAIFDRPGTRVVVLTTNHGAALARERTRSARSAVDIRVHGERTVDVAQAMAGLYEDGHRSVNCEGGPRAYGSLLAAGCVDDELLTLSPIIIGRDEQNFRPSLVEGVAFGPTDPPASRIMSLARAGNHLFLRSAYAD